MSVVIIIYDTTHIIFSNEMWAWFFSKMNSVLTFIFAIHLTRNEILQKYSGSNRQYSTCKNQQADSRNSGFGTGKS